MPDAVDTVCAPDNGWSYHPKHIEQFPDKINCAALHLIGYMIYNMRYLLTAVGLSPGGSTHSHTNNT